MNGVTAQQCQPLAPRPLTLPAPLTPFALPRLSVTGLPFSSAGTTTRRAAPRPAAASLPLPGPNAVLCRAPRLAALGLGLPRLRALLPLPLGAVRQPCASSRRCPGNRRPLIGRRTAAEWPFARRAPSPNGRCPRAAIGALRAAARYLRQREQISAPLGSAAQRRARRPQPWGAELPLIPVIVQRMF